jgi:hypothetical protein
VRGDEGRPVAIRTTVKMKMFGQRELGAVFRKNAGLHCGFFRCARCEASAHQFGPQSGSLAAICNNNAELSLPYLPLQDQLSNAEPHAGQCAYPPGSATSATSRP